MAKRSSSGVAAWFDRSTVAQCPSCEAQDPDPARRGHCATCGALFRDKLKARRQVAMALAMLGVVMVAAGALLTLVVEQKWPGVALFTFGLAPLALGLLAIGGHAKSLLAALALRSTPETLRLLSSTDRLCAMATVVFAALFVACIPYYLYVEAPRQQLGSYQSVFGDKVQEYAALVAADAVAPEDAVARRAGKLVVIDKPPQGQAQVSAIHAQLPAELRAENVAEVGTVALIDWADVKFGTYGAGGAPAYRVDAHIMLVDPASKSLIAKAEFKGGEPPATAPGNGEPGRGARPTAAVIKFLSALPVAEAAAKPTPAATE